MSQMVAASWYETNQECLLGAIAQVRQQLEAKLDPTQNASPLRILAPDSALAQLSALFRLSPFEQAILLLCAGMELDSTFAQLCATIHGDAQRPFPTFSLALSALAEPYWHALSPSAPLRYWQLVELGAGKTLTSSPLRIDERILHFLIGVSELDERLASLVRPVAASTPLVPSHQAIARQVAALWQTKLGQGNLPLIQLCGGDAPAKEVIAAAACTQLGLNLYALSTAVLPTNGADLYTLQRLWQREALLSHSALLIIADETPTNETGQPGGNGLSPRSTIARLIEYISTPVLLSTGERQAQHRPSVTLEVKPPRPEEQTLLWQQSLNHRVQVNSQIEAIVSQFNLSPLTIQTICTEADAQLENGTNRGDATEPDRRTSDQTATTADTLLWDLCRTQARPRMDDLAQRIESNALWDDLVLPEPQKQTLRDIAAHVRHRAQVYEQWGFANKGDRGLGITALFAGASGTGKTMAADVLAKELRLDLYRIDLSQMVSKYIGETEKNLRRVFDAAEAGGVILLFDEADALFGKRSEVKDSHDRYANMEVSYLLQRMEAYRGLAILTTNLKEAIDIAFLRRLRFVVKFPFPDAAQRAEIWRHVFPKQAPTKGLDYTKLARLSVAGGNIRNIALNAAFIAAAEQQPVQMKHILAAAHSEYIKLERTLTEVEIKGWVLSGAEKS